MARPHLDKFVFKKVKVRRPQHLYLYRKSYSHRGRPGCMKIWEDEDGTHIELETRAGYQTFVESRPDLRTITIHIEEIPLP